VLEDVRLVASVDVPVPVGCKRELHYVLNEDQLRWLREWDGDAE
jgi:hypothetical protein